MIPCLLAEIVRDESILQPPCIAKKTALTFCSSFTVLCPVKNAAKYHSTSPTQKVRVPPASPSFSYFSQSDVQALHLDGEERKNGNKNGRERNLHIEHARAQDVIQRIFRPRHPLYRTPSYA